MAERIAAAKKAMAPEPAHEAAKKYNALSLAWRMVIELVVGTGLGFCIGYSLDSMIGTAPALLIIFGLLGFAAGVRTMLASAEEVSRAHRTQAPETKND